MSIRYKTIEEQVVCDGCGASYSPHAWKGERRGLKPGWVNIASVYGNIGHIGDRHVCSAKCLRDFMFISYETLAFGSSLEY